MNFSSSPCLVAASHRTIQFLSFISIAFGQLCSSGVRISTSLLLHPEQQFPPTAVKSRLVEKKDIKKIETRRRGDNPKTTFSEATLTCDVIFMAFTFLLVFLSN
jgi:hypothetical protein